MQRVLVELEPALQAAVVASNTEVPGGYRFTHALIRETIYEDLAAAERVRLHARAAAALVAIHSAYLQPVLTRIAHHYYESVALGHTQEAVSYALLAADSAARMYAFEEAILHYDRTIRTLENAGLRQDGRLARAYILKASALKQMGQIPQSVDVLLEAVNRTRVLGSAELLVDLVMLVTSSSRHWPHQHFVPLLERVLEVLPAVDSPSRAKALSTLAFAQRTSLDRRRLAEQVEAALAMAERVCDATARCACYELAAICFRGHPENLQRRLLLGSEHIAVARSTGKRICLPTPIIGRCSISSNPHESMNWSPCFGNMANSRRNHRDPSISAGCASRDVGAAARGMGRAGGPDRRAARDRHEDPAR